jgi:hypothetical protein
VEYKKEGRGKMKISYDVLEKSRMGGVGCHTGIVKPGDNFCSDPICCNPKYREGKAVGKWIGYEKLYDVFMDAMYRASCGKGKERHVSGDEPFEEQFILRGARTFGIAALRFQIAKKNEEVGNIIDYQAKINEFLDIAVYAAAAIIRLREVIEERNLEVPT